MLLFFADDINDDLNNGSPLTIDEMLKKLIKKRF